MFAVVVIGSQLRLALHSDELCFLPDWKEKSASSGCLAFAQLCASAVPFKSNTIAGCEKAPAACALVDDATSSEGQAAALFSLSLAAREGPHKAQSSLSGWPFPTPKLV
eukprot:1574485-Amphidinium_carterae.1